MNGEIIYLFVYNTGAKFTDEQLRGLLKNPENFSKYEYARPKPEEIASFNMPSIFNLKGDTYTDQEVLLKFKVQVAIYNNGSFSLRFRCQILNSDLSRISEITFDKKINDFLRDASAKERAKVEKALSKITLIRPSEFTETYRIYYIEGDKQKIVEKNKKLIAGLLIDESNSQSLSDEYMQEVLSRNMSYSSSDVVFIGWESAVMIDKSKAYEHELLVGEISNVQLLQMRISHSETSSKISETEDRMITILAEKKGPGKTLKELDLQLGQFYDETRDKVNYVDDTISGFGEWYILKLYNLYDDVFKITKWKQSVEDDLDIIDKRWEFVTEMMRNRRSDLLELIVIALIVIEVILEVIFLLKP